MAAGAYAMVPGAGSGAGQVLFGTFAGGITADLTGGNFWEGAAMGMTVSWLNHAFHSNKFNKEINKHYGKKADTPVYGMSQEDICDAISNLPTLKRLYAKLFRKFPGLQVNYDSTFGADDGKTFFNTSSEIVSSITIFRSAGQSYRYMAQTILHEFGHGMSGYYGFFFKNFRKYGEYSRVPIALDEIYAHKFAYYYGGAHFNTPYYLSEVDFLRRTSYNIDANRVGLPPF